MSLVLFSGDAHFLLVVAVSLVLCLFLFLLVRAYGRNIRYRGKERQIQRPFIKGKRGPQTRRSPVLLGNLFTSVPSGSPPRRNQYALTGKNVNAVNSLFANGKPPIRIIDRDFLGNVITSVHQQQRKSLSPLVMKKSTPQRSVEPNVLYKCQPPQEHSNENHDCGKDDSAVACIVYPEEDDACAKLIVPENHIKTDKRAHSTAAIHNRVTYPSTSTAAYISVKQVPTTCSSTSNLKVAQGDLGQSKNIVNDSVPSTTRAKAPGNAHQCKTLWAHSCDHKELAQKASEGDPHKTPMSVKSNTADKFEYVRLQGTGNVTTGIKKLFSFNKTNNKKDDCRDSLDKIHREPERKSRRKKGKKGSKGIIDQEESDACKHKVSKGNDIVKNASKTEVLCMLCGIKLSKPQCFYSLGSLCTDGEFCETDSDDVNRHPVGDIDDFPPQTDVQSHHDTGYTSSDDFENDNGLLKDCRSGGEWNKPETDSYDGDYESDNNGSGERLDKMSDDMALKPFASVGEPIPIKDYALQEWKSETTTSIAMKKGYESILLRTKCQHLRQIRGDNYCAIRAVLFQILAGEQTNLNLFAPEKMTRLENIPSSLAAVDHWSFANRLPVAQSEVVKTLEKFLAFFSDKIRKIHDISSQPERIESVLSLLNNEPEEFKMLEATKLLMYDAAVQLFRKLNKREDVPVFSLLLFARDSCESPGDLLVNHLNRTGDTGGLEQVEMCLLGFALGVVIQVFRPSQVDKEDFIAYYPPLDDVAKYTPTVTLVAEDDRHYNVVM
ncbi:uncharacterized protein [Montipora foliosa]|uniref:uncharacterized protein isoform X1 n=1 Tax=Montipora foliosa TaxID=591990 RepID=UPI0035F1A4FB